MFTCLLYHHSWAFALFYCKQIADCNVFLLDVSFKFWKSPPGYCMLSIWLISSALQCFWATMECFLEAFKVTATVCTQLHKAVKLQFKSMKAQLLRSKGLYHGLSTFKIGLNIQIIQDRLVQTGLTLSMTIHTFVKDISILIIYHILIFSRESFITWTLNDREWKRLLQKYPELIHICWRGPHQLKWNRISDPFIALIWLVCLSLVRF